VPALLRVFQSNRSCRRACAAPGCFDGIHAGIKILTRPADTQPPQRFSLLESCRNTREVVHVIPERAWPGVYDGNARRCPWAAYWRIRSSLVSRTAPSCRAVATMRRSAEPPWKSPGRRELWIQIEGVRGTNDIPGLWKALSTQSSHDMSNRSLPLASSMPTSQADMALTRRKDSSPAISISDRAS